MPAKPRHRAVATSVAVRNPSVATLAAGAVPGPGGPAPVHGAGHLPLEDALSGETNALLAAVGAVGHEHALEVATVTVPVSL